MTLACWNVRGLHKPLKQKSVQAILHTRNIDVLGILESKFDEKSLSSMMRIRFPGMRAIHNFCLNTKGRICVLWNPNIVDLNVLSMTEQSIHVCIEFLSSKMRFCASFVYGLHTIVLRRALWADLIEFGVTCSLPWMVLGDFNTVLSPDEKVGGLMVKNYDTKDFVDCVATLDLMDLRQVGCAFTWSNPKVCSKLDRVLVNQLWVASHLDGFVDFVPPGCVSDHTISIVSFVDPLVKREKPFKFFNMWALSDSFLETVARHWKFLGHGTAQFSLKQMLTNLKQPLKQLNKKQFSHISSRASAASTSFSKVQRDMLHSGVTPLGYGELKRRTELLLEAERSFIAQKAKLSYLQQGDRCTKFFHDLIKRNNKRNAIVAINNTAGVTITDPDLIAEITPIDSEAILDGPCVPLESWAALIAPVSTDEIEAALFDIDFDKAPGADGSRILLKWSVCFGNGTMPSLPLFQNRWTPPRLMIFGRFLVALCSTNYCQDLSKRLGEVVGSLIDEAQAAFIRGRSIVDNIHLAQELLRKYARKRGSHAVHSQSGHSESAFSPGTLPFRYLGVPLAARNLRSQDYSKLVDSIAAKLSSWPRQSLSYAGKIELVRSVVQGIECFWLSILPIPNCIIDAIHSLCRKFVWPTKHPPIAWDTLCKSIDDGGLGLKNLKCWNKALIAKTLWKIQMQKESLWIRWILAIRDEIALRVGFGGRGLLTRCTPGFLMLRDLEKHMISSPTRLWTTYISVAPFSVAVWRAIRDWLGMSRIWHPSTRVAASILESLRREEVGKEGGGKLECARCESQPCSYSVQHWTLPPSPTTD
ncbi:uncharacterized protein, partial [Primulina eburnea]|uniref:uncharacterized protein n=1 Tax=Primulina eburnea TaxID=1245227 RepID=UPI003C6BFE33